MTHTAMILAALAAGFALVAAHAFAQEPGSVELTAPAKPEWAWEHVANLNAGEKVALVLKANPAHRMSCRVAFAADASIGCSRRFGKKPAVFDRGDIHAVIKPRSSDPSFLQSFATLVAGGGALTGAVFLARIGTIALVGAIPIGFVGGVLVLGSIYLFAATEHHPEVLLYSADVTSLSQLKHALPL